MSTADRDVPMRSLLAALVALAACAVRSGEETAQKPTQSLGAFIAPVGATASSSQEGAGRVPLKVIDGSGFDENVLGSGVYVHTCNVYADGNCMWNGGLGKDTWISFDLGKECNVNGMFVWNYNEA